MLKYTIRPVFWVHKVNSKGTGPVMIAVTIERKVRYFKTPFRVRTQEWKDGQVIGLPNAALINKSIRRQIDELEAELLGRNHAGEAVTSRNLKITRLHKFFDFVQQVQKNLSIGTRRRYICEAGRIKTFSGPDLLIRDINATFIREFEQHERKRRMAQNTLNTAIRWLKAILNKARKEGLIKDLPIYETPKYVNPERFYLTGEELSQWVTYWREKRVAGPLYDALTWFLFGCYTGLRHSDWEQFDYKRRIENDLLKLRAKKNGVWVVLPIGPTLAEIIDVVKDLPPPLSAEKTRAYLKILAGRLGCIKNITTHVCRHSACAMFARLRIPKSTAAELLGISEKVVSIYYHLGGQDILDQAAILKTV